jgi:hypothetical protein
VSELTTCPPGSTPEPRSAARWSTRAVSPAGRRRSRRASARRRRGAPTRPSTAPSPPSSVHRPRPEELTPAAVRAYRDHLEQAGRSPAAVAKHLSALRALADALGADPAMRTVRSAQVARGEPRALTHDEFARLLRMPTAAPARASATSRCCTCSAPPGCGAPRPPISWWPTSTSAAAPPIPACARRSPARRAGGDRPLRQRGRTRAIPLDEDALGAIAAWVKGSPRRRD